MGAKRKAKLTKKQRATLSKKVAPDLEVYNLLEWQKACRGFGPVHLDKQTRKEWFNDYKSRIAVSREIVGFIESWKTKYQNDDEFSDIRVTVIVRELIDVVRKAQKKQGMKLGLLNVVKLAGFKTLVKWADNPSEIKKAGKKRTRKKRGKKVFAPPKVEFVRDAEIEEKRRMLITIVIKNPGRTPYQNVEFELKPDSNLSVLNVEQYTWSPLHNSIRIGFIGSSLKNKATECLLKVHLAMTRKRRKYKLEGKIIYDDYEKGERVESQLEPVLIEV